MAVWKLDYIKVIVPQGRLRSGMFIYWFLLPLFSLPTHGWPRGVFFPSWGLRREGFNIPWSFTLPRLPIPRRGGSCCTRCWAIFILVKHPLFSSGGIFTLSLTEKIMMSRHDNIKYEIGFGKGVLFIKYDPLCCDPHDLEWRGRYIPMEGNTSIFGLLHDQRAKDHLDPPFGQFVDATSKIWERESRPSPLKWLERHHIAPSPTWTYLSSLHKDFSKHLIVESVMSPSHYYAESMSKKIKEHPTTGYTPRLEQIIWKPLSKPLHIRGNLRRGNIDCCKKFHFERCKRNQNPHLINIGEVDVKVWSGRLTGSIHISPLLLVTIFHNHVSLYLYLSRPVLENIKSYL